MPIPELNDVPGERHPLLPEGVFPCDIAELYAATVRGFPQSPTRPQLWSRFHRLVQELEACGLGATLWIDGSFVTGKPDPNDVDVVAFIDSATIDKLSARCFTFLMQLIHDGSSCHHRYGTHLFLVPAHAAGTPRHAAYEAMRCYWRKWWGQTRAGATKGFLVLQIGAPGTAPQVPTHRCD